MDINLMIGIGSGIFSAGVAWGLNRGEIASLKKEIGNLKEKQKDDLMELKTDFKEIKKMLNSILIQFSSIKSVLKYKEQIEVDETE